MPFRHGHPSYYRGGVATERAERLLYAQRPRRAPLRPPFPACTRCRGSIMALGTDGLGHIDYACLQCGETLERQGWYAAAVEAQ